MESAIARQWQAAPLMHCPNGHNCKVTRKIDDRREPGKRRQVKTASGGNSARAIAPNNKPGDNMAEKAMRAKFVINEVKRTQHSEQLAMSAVCKDGGYDETGLDEDNTFAKLSPFGQLTLTVANPALFGKFNPGEKYYLDFVRADAPATVAG